MPILPETTFTLESIPETTDIHNSHLPTPLETHKSTLPTPLETHNSPLPAPQTLLITNNHPMQT